MKHFYLILFFLLVVCARTFAAVGCDLNDPDRDVKRLFSRQTSYKTTYFSLRDKGGEILQKKIEQRLGDNFKGLFENADVPYTLYSVYRNKELIGYIHGVNQKGEFGGIQVFLVLNPDGIINNIYFQKVTSQKAALFRSKEFSRQFIGLSLRDFYGYNVQDYKADTGNRISGIINPVPSSTQDFYAILRGVKKNLILLDEFVFDNQHLKYFSQKEKQ